MRFGRDHPPLEKGCATEFFFWVDGRRLNVRGASGAAAAATLRDGRRMALLRGFRGVRDRIFFLG